MEVQECPSFVSYKTMHNNKIIYTGEVNTLGNQKWGRFHSKESMCHPLSTSRRIKCSVHENTRALQSENEALYRVDKSKSVELL